MLESYKWDWDGMDGRKSLWALIIRAPLCGANNLIGVHPDHADGDHDQDHDDGDHDDDGDDDSGDDVDDICLLAASLCRPGQFRCGDGRCVDQSRSHLYFNILHSKENFAKIGRDICFLSGSVMAFTTALMLRMRETAVRSFIFNLTHSSSSSS